MLKIEFVNIKYRRSSNEKSNNYSIRRLLDFDKTSIHNRALRFFVINNTKRFTIHILTIYRKFRFKFQKYRYKNILINENIVNFKIFNIRIINIDINNI